MDSIILPIAGTRARSVSPCLSFARDGFFWAQIMKAILLGCILIGTVCANAATKTWDGSSSGNWATAANWSGGTLPAAGDDLIFPLNVTRTNMTNNFSPNRAFNSVTFLGTNYLLDGSTLIVTNGIRSGTPQGDNLHRIPNTIVADVQLGGAQTFVVSNLFTKLIFLGNISLGANTLTVDGDGDTDCEGIISGTAGIEKLGFGTMTVAGDNTFSGPVNIRDGRLVADAGFADNTVLGSTSAGTTVFAGALLESRLSFTNETLTLSGGSWFNNSSPGIWHGPVNVVSNSSVDAAGRLIISGVISGSGKLSIDTALSPLWADCIFGGTANNTITGTVQLEEGILILDKSSGALAINAGPLIVGDGVGTSPTNAIVRHGAANQIGIGHVTVLSDGMLDLDGNSDTINALTIVGGVVTNNGTGSLQLGGNVFATSSTSAPARIRSQLNLGSAQRTFFVTNGPAGSDLEIEARVFGAVNLNKNEDGIMSLLVSNSFSGITHVLAGTLQVDNDFAFGTLGGDRVVVHDGATLTLLTGANNIEQNVGLNGVGVGGIGALRSIGTVSWNGDVTLVTDPAINVATGTLTLSGQVLGAGGFSKIGPGTLRLSGTNDNIYSGDTTVRAGVLELAKTSAFAISNSAALTIGDESDGSSTDTVRYAADNQLRTTVNIFINRTGLLDLNNFTDDVGDISMVGGTIDSGTGTLQLRGTLTAIGTSSGFTPFAAEIFGNLDLGTLGRTMVVNDGFAAEDLIVLATIGGTASLTKNGAGVLFLGGTNSFSGLLTVNDGRVIVTNALSLGQTNNGVVLNGDANLELRNNVTIVSEPLTLNTVNTAFGALYTPSGIATWTGPIVLSTTATILPNDGAAGIVLSGSISGGAGLTKIGPGTLTYSGNLANTYSGITTVNEGTLLLAKAVANNSVVGPLVIGDGVGGANVDVLRLQGTSQLGSLVAITLNSSGLFDLNGITETFGSLAGSGNVTLGGANVNPGGDGSSTTFSGVISETGSFTKSGAGTMTLNGNNSYTGATTVSAGTLLVNGSQPQSAVSIGSSGTLGGTGTVGSVAANGSLSPGTSPGILTTSNLTFSASGDFFVDLIGTTAGTGYDQVNVRGTNNLANAVLHLNANFTQPVNLGQQFTIIVNDGAEPISGTFSGLPENAGISANGFGFRINYAAGTGNDVVLTLTNVPNDFFFTNSLGGDFLVGANWIPNFPPGATNNANFTNNANYQVTWSASRTNGNAFFNAGSGTVTQAIGASTWLLTNSYVAGQNGGAVASVVHSSGALRVTNSAGTGRLIVGQNGRGAFQLAGAAATVVADRLLVTNNLGGSFTNSIFTFSHGTLTTLSNSTISQPDRLKLGTASGQTATWKLLGGINTWRTDFGLTDIGAGAAGIVQVDGPATVLTNVDFLNVGEDSPNSSLSLSNGARLVTFTTALGDSAASSNNTVVVNGSGSSWLNTGALILGYLSPGNQMLISAAGAVTNGVGIIGSASGQNSATVTGNGSIWNVAVGPTVGGSGTNNRLSIFSGGRVLSAGGTIGNGATTSNHVVTVDGANALWSDTSDLSIGASNSDGNALVVTNGGQVVNQGAALGLTTGATNNRATVTGTGSLWSNRLDLTVGRFGPDNQLQVLNGASVINANGIIGANPVANNNRVVVSGTGSAWSNSASVTVGGSGSTNQLLLTNGTVIATGVTLGANSSSTNNRIVVVGGALRVTNVTATAALDIRRGTNQLNSGVIETDSLLMNNPLGFFEFNGGTLLLRSSTVANGQPFRAGNGASAALLQLVGNGACAFTDGLIIANNATLAGNGSIIGPVTVLPGGIMAPGASVGLISLSQSPVLSGALNLEISKVGSTLTNDQILVNAPVTYGGTLTVVKLGADSLAAGDRFPLFAASSYSGAFSSITLPPLDPSLTWDNRLLLDGSLAVVAVTPPLATNAYVTARPSPTGTGPNPNGTYFEFINLGDSTAKSSVSDAPPRDGSRAYLSSTPLTNISAGFDIMPALPVPGAIYQIEHTFNSGAGNINTNAVFSVSSTNASLSVAGTDKFQTQYGAAPNSWSTIGFLTNNPGVASPRVAFRYLSGFINDTKRLTVDAFRFSMVASRVHFTNVFVAGTSLVTAGADGVPNEPYTVLSSTNIALPLTNWTPILTNQFDSAGNFSFTNGISPAVPQRFYRLRLP